MSRNDNRLYLFNPSLNEDSYLDEGFFSVKGSNNNNNTRRLGGLYADDSPRHMTSSSNNSFRAPTTAPIQQKPVNRPVNNNNSSLSQSNPKPNPNLNQTPSTNIRATPMRVGKDKYGRTIIHPEMQKRLIANARDPYITRKIKGMDSIGKSELLDNLKQMQDNLSKKSLNASAMPYLFRSPYLFLEDDNEEKELKNKREKLSTAEKYSPLRVLGKVFGAANRHFQKGYTQGYGGTHKGMYGADMGYNPIPSKGFKEGAECCCCDCDNDDRLSLFKGHFSSSSLFDNDIDGTWDNVEDDFNKNYSLFRSPGDEFNRNVNDVAFRAARTSGGVPHPLSAFNGVNKISEDSFFFR